MSRWFHVWWLLIIALIVGAIIVLYGLFNTSQQLNANSLYDAVYDSAQYARDDSARGSRGTFVINRKVFEDRLSSYNIRGIGAISKYGENGSGNKSHNRLYIHYYLDNGNSELNPKDDSNGVANEQLNSKKYSDNLKSNEKDTYISIRAIQVQALTNSQQHEWKDKNVTHYSASNKKIIDDSNKQGEQAPSGITNVNNKYVATLVVQSQDAMKNNKFSKNMNDFKTKQSQQQKASTNNPIRDPNKTDRNYEDLTVPSYSKYKDNAGKTVSGENNTEDTLDTRLKN